jgi:hypothetical protein
MGRSCLFVQILQFRMILMVIVILDCTGELWSQDSSVIIALSCGLVDLGIVFNYQQDRHWRTSSLMSNGYQEPFSRDKVAQV